MKEKRHAVRKVRLANKAEMCTFATAEPWNGKHQSTHPRASAVPCARNGRCLHKERSLLAQGTARACGSVFGNVLP